MTTPTFITGNPEKAKRFNAALGIELPHQALDIPEIQSLSIDEVVEAKARSAFASVGTPVIVEDVSLTITALGKLPGPFIKFFLESLSLDQICKLTPTDNRAAIAEVAFGYCDGERLEIIKKTTSGTIPESPSGTSGFGWDAIFIPENTTCTAAELPEAKYERYYALNYKPFKGLRSFLNSR